MSRSPLTPAIERARALISAGDLGSAQVLLERAVELGRENLGEDDSDVLAAQRELAGVFLRLDDPMAARRVLEDAYAAGQWRLGDGDPLILHISYDLGVVAQELGNRHEARRAFGRVAAHGPSALGEGHRFVVQARSYLDGGPSGATVRPDALPRQPTLRSRPVSPWQTVPPVDFTLPPRPAGTSAAGPVPAGIDGAPPLPSFAGPVHVPGLSGEAAVPPVNTAAVSPPVDGEAALSPADGEASLSPVDAVALLPTTPVNPAVPPVNPAAPPVNPAAASAGDVTAALNPGFGAPLVDPAAAPVTDVVAALSPAPGVSSESPARGPEGDAWSVPTGPAEVVAVTRPAAPSPVERPPVRAGNPWGDAPAVPDQRRPGTEPHPNVGGVYVTRQSRQGESHRGESRQGESHQGHSRQGESRQGESHRNEYRQGGHGVVAHRQADQPGEAPPPRHGALQSTGWPTEPQHDVGAGDPYRSGGRGVALGLAAVAVLVALVAVGALVVVLADREKNDEPVIPVATVSAGPQLSGAPPAAVELTDRGAVIEVSWRDPSVGKAPFMVTMAREGQQLKPVAQVGPGVTTTTVAGLNPKLQYCFAVVAVYSVDRFASSAQACTERD